MKRKDLLLGCLATVTVIFALTAGARATSERVRALPLSLVRAAQPSQTLPPAGYHLTFEDTFHELSISDEDGGNPRWYAQSVQCCMMDTSAPATPTHMAGVSSPGDQNPYAILPNQGLRIRLQRTPTGWYSGVIATVDRNGHGFAQQYGYFEMTAQFPSAPGTWPAFWLLNQRARSEHAPAAEIDVVESYMFAPNYINTTVHDWKPPSREIAHALSKVADLSQGLHTFGLLWTAETMHYYCDGKEIYRMPTPEMMHQPFYPIVDLGIGGGWPTDKTPQHADMIVRAVRVYAPDRTAAINLN